MSNFLSAIKLIFFVPSKKVEFMLTWRSVFVSFSLVLLIGILGEALVTTPPRAFDYAGFTDAGFLVSLLLMTGAYLGGLFQSEVAILRFLQAISNTMTAILILAFSYACAANSIGELVGEEVFRDYWYYPWLVLLGWYGLAVIRCVLYASLASDKVLLWDKIAAATTVILILVAATNLVQGHGFWQHDRGDIALAKTEPPWHEALNAEEILVSQSALLSQLLARIPASAPGEKDWFFIAYAPWGEQDVFRNEVRLADEIWQQDYQVGQRRVSLVSHPDTADSQPLAIRANLETTLKELGAKSQEEDILFLYITSHGSSDHRIGAQLGSLPLNDLPAAELGRMVAESGFHWKVIVVSSCYSGGFLPLLEGPETLVMSAARSDRTSFGCSDDAELTYFGRALLAEAFSMTDDFVEAFEIARERVTEWESIEGYTPSEPQIRVGDAIQDYLGLKAVPTPTALCQTECDEASSDLIIR